MSNTAYDLTKRLLNALDSNYNVVDMCAISEIISVLENINITKELLETTRLGKHVNELRRRTGDPALARRAKLLVKRWRDLVIPDRTGVRATTQPASSESTPRVSPAATPRGPSPAVTPRGLSPAVTPAVTPRLCSPQVAPQGLTLAQRQGSITPSSGAIKPAVVPYQQHISRRQPLTSPALQNVSLSSGLKAHSPGLKHMSPGHRTISPGLKNISPGHRTISPGLKIISPGLKNISPGHRTISPGLKIISPGLKNISPALKNVSPGHRNIPLTNANISSGIKNSSPGVRNSSSATKHISPGSKDVSPGIKNFSPKNISPRYTNAPLGMKNVSPGAPLVSKNISPGSFHTSKNISPGSRSVGLGLPLGKNMAHAVKNLSPALRIQSETAHSITLPKRVDSYDSDSQDVIFVDDDDDVKPAIVNSQRGNDVSLLSRATKRPRSPVNGEPGPLLDIKGSVDSRRDAKKAHREPGGRKAKKRRNHTKSENRTVDHSLDPVTSPFLPISSASTSPALPASSLKNGLSIAAPSPINASLLIDDLDSRSPKPEPKPRISRKNGCKKSSVDMDDYSTFIKNKIPAAGKKVKTTKELLEEIQARKSGKLIAIEEKNIKPKEDFLTAYDNKKKETNAVIISDVIELNDSNSSVKQEIQHETEKVEIKMETKEGATEGPVKFEPVEVILSRLPPIDKSWMSGDDVEMAPHCTCSMIYNTPEVEVKMPSPPQPPKRSIFELDYEESAMDSKEESISSVFVPAPPLYEEKLDPNCEAAVVFHHQPANTGESHVLALHNCYIPDVNSTQCEKEREKRPACKFDQWGLKPYYDCPRGLFHDIVPKYNFLDYSLDGCVKNLSKINFGRHSPVEATETTTAWLKELEEKTGEELRRKAKTDEEYHSPADSPFSERMPLGDGDSVKDNVSLDSDLACSNSVNACDDNASRGASNNNDPPHIKKREEELMDCDSVDRLSPRPDSIFSYQSDNTRDNYDDTTNHSLPDKKCGDITKSAQRQRLFSYGDSVMTLPLSLSALNDRSAERVDDEKCDLSCVFRTKGANESDNPSADLTYNQVAEPVSLNLKNLSDGIVERLRRCGTTEPSPNLAQDEDTVCDVIDSKAGVQVKKDQSVNGALEECVADGCPAWLNRLSRVDDFREWHESVVRTSYNGEPLTILPYVIID